MRRISNLASRSNLYFYIGTFLVLALLASRVAQAQTTNYTLGTTALLEGPLAGSDSVVLAVAPATADWTATTNDTWLHLSPANQSGTGSTNVIFSFDANPGSTRIGHLTISGLALTVTQAGSNYVATTGVMKENFGGSIESGLVTALVSSNLASPRGVAVDNMGNVYVANTGSNTIEEWIVASNIVTTLVSSNLSSPYGVAVDGAGNVYISDTGNNAIKEWVASSNVVTTLVSSGLNQPKGVAVDGAGNVYIADSANAVVKEWTASNNIVTTLVSLVPYSLYDVAVDVAGNVYIAVANHTIKEWNAVNNGLTTLVSMGTPTAYGLCVDGSGNVYYSDYYNNAIKKWSAASKTASNLVAKLLNGPSGVAMDAAGNVYFTDIVINAVREVPHAFVDPTPRSESLTGSNDALPVVLPSTANLLPPFTPTTDQPWVTINGITNGIVSFSVTASPYNRTADIALLGQTIPILQRAPPIAPTNSLGATALLEASIAGSDSVILALVQNNDPWTNTANATWLHLNPANQSGTGSTNVIFSYDANIGPTRSGTLTIDGLTLTVTQAGSNYVAAGTVTTLVGSGIANPYGLAVDSLGNVYIANTGSNAIEEWTMTNNAVATLVFSGLQEPYGVAVDGAGNVYIADTSNNAIKKWTAANNTVTTLVSSGLFFPNGVAADSAGNVYICDTYDNAVKEWTGASNDVLTLTLVSSGLFFPNGVAVDAAGNVYIANSGSNAIVEWTMANNTESTLASSKPTGVAVDGAGNVYIADFGNNAIEEWTAANHIVTTLVSSGLNNPYGVAVDGARNVYIADTYDSAIKELPYVFVDPTPKLEGLEEGADSLPVVLPITANLLPPFAPASDQSWLTITGITNGVVSFSFTADTGPARTAHINLFDQSIPITQGTIGTPPILTNIQILASNILQFEFTNIQTASLTVLSSTNLSLPMSNWTAIGTASNTAPGQFQFTSQPTTNDAQRFYGVRSP
jgi:DNA-binding beta-propeller fold protein YncE